MRWLLGGRTLLLEVLPVHSLEMIAQATGGLGDYRFVETNIQTRNTGAMSCRVHGFVKVPKPRFRVFVYTPKRILGRIYEQTSYVM